VETFAEVLRRLRTANGLTQGDLGKQANWSQSQVSRSEKGTFVPDATTVDRLDSVLGANGQLIKAYRNSQSSGLEVVTAGSDPLAFSDLMRQIHRTNVGRETIESLHVITEQLCCEYVSWPADLRADAHRQLEYVNQLLSGSITLAEHRELLVIAGWLSLLIGCVNYDLGLLPHAETARHAAAQLGREAGHGEIVAWSHEMSAWFALTQGRLRSIAEYVDAGIDAAPHASVTVQLAGQAAKAHARMGNPSDVRRALDRGVKLLDGHEHPSRPDNHFVVDPAKWDFYEMDCYRIVGENERASEHAQEVLALSGRPDGSDLSPMRASEARLTLAVVSLRNGDLDGAAEWARKAFSEDRRSVKSLGMVVDELWTEARRKHGNDPAVGVLKDVIASFYASISDR